METAAQLAVRLTSASRRKSWDVFNLLEWPEKLSDMWCMPPELVSLYGTPVWDTLDIDQQKRLALYECCNFFSLVLQGERPLVQGLVHRYHQKGNPREITDYLLHFVDEENKHMMMFGEFCNRYIGKVYPEKKIALTRQWAKGEEEVAFFCKAMVVEELGDYYNVVIDRDERVDPFVRAVNYQHHVDEARHLAFGRVYLAEAFQKHAPTWSAETLAGFRTWLADYLRSSWGDYYNPTMYRDAGLADGYEMRQLAMTHEAPAALRRKASAKIVKYFIQTGLLVEEPQL